MRTWLRNSNVARRLVGVLVATSLATAVAGCATPPGASSSPSTPYKGNAVWNVA